MSTTVTSSIIFGLNVSNLDLNVDIDENYLYDMHSRFEDDVYLYLSGDGDDYFGILIDTADFGPRSSEWLSTKTFSEIQNAITEDDKTKLVQKLKQYFIEPETGFNQMLDFMFTVTYS